MNAIAETPQSMQAITRRFTGEELAKVKELQHLRGTVYFFLSKLFLEEPKEGFVSRLADTNFFLEFRVPESDELTEGTKFLEKFFGGYRRAERPSSLEELKLEYTRLFLGPDSLPSPPWESAYRAESQILFGQETLEVRNEYAAFGLSFTRNETEPDDHIGLELEFLSHLCRELEEAFERSDRAKALRVLEAQRTFFDEHINLWAHLFCKDVFDNAKTLFYQGMAKFTSGFLQWDYLLLLELIEELKEEDTPQASGAN